MGIVLTVLEPPHPPEPNLTAALPPGTGRVIDVEPRLVSPRYDTLLVTTRGLVLRDHVSGDFHGVPWTNFSLHDHLHHHSHHATLILWLDERRPIEVAITRRLALNIASVAPVLTSDPTANVDDVVLADGRSDAIDLRRSPEPRFSAPPPVERFEGLPPPDPTPRPISSAPSPDTPASVGASGRFPGGRVLTGVAVLVIAGAVGGLASIVVNGDGNSADGAVPQITSEAVEADQLD